MKTNPLQIGRGSSPCRFESLESRQMMSAGDPDLSFSGDGRTTVNFLGGLIAHATDAAVQKDGKTVVVGFVEGGGRHFAIARLNFDGTPDPTFDGDGLVVVPVGEIGDARASAVAIQGDGKIVVAGSARMDHLGSFNGPEFGVIRLTTDGRLDRSFHGDGVRTIDFDGGATDIALQSNGKIVIVGNNHDAGFLGFGGDTNFAIARLNSNGLLDGTFGDDGKTQIGFGGDDRAEAVALGPGGKIIVVGHNGSEFSSSKIAITRLNSNGSRDGTFGPARDGTMLMSFPGQPVSSAHDVIVQSGGKIVIAGTTGNPSNPNSMQFALARVLSDGQIDGSFGPAGAGVVATELGGNDVAMGIMTSADGLMVAGSSNRKFALASYTADGVPNNNFGTAGKIVTDFGLADPSLGMGLAKGTGMRRFVVAGGNQFSTARFLDTGANVVSVGSFDTNAAEQGSDPAALIVTRTERLPFATHVSFSIGGTARGPTASPNTIDYDLAGMSFPFVFNGAQIGTQPFVTIPAGETFTTVTLTPRDDARRENTETASFTIVPTTGLTVFGHDYVIGSNASVTARIVDNDGPISATLPTAIPAPSGGARIFSQVAI